VALKIALQAIFSTDQNRMLFVLLPALEMREVLLRFKPRAAQALRADCQGDVSQWTLRCFVIHLNRSLHGLLL